MWRFLRQIWVMLRLAVMQIYSLFMLGLASVLAIGMVNLVVSFSLALTVALRSRGTRLGSMRNLLKSFWSQVKANPLILLYPVQVNNKDNTK